jgi:hypothetical protein
MIRMAAMSEHDRRIVRFAAIAIAIYLALFGGFEAWQFLGHKRADYRRLHDAAKDLRNHAAPYPDKVALVRKLMNEFHFDPARQQRETLVSDASAAIQQAARSGGLQLGAIRETPGRGSGRALATLQLDGFGPVTSVLSFLAGLNTIGYPLVVDSVQFVADNRPGSVKLNLTILILDFNRQPAPKEAPHA